MMDTTNEEWEEDEKVVEGARNERGNVMMDDSRSRRLATSVISRTTRASSGADGGVAR
jgi:hypothetical protein